MHDVAINSKNKHTDPSNPSVTSLLPIILSLPLDYGTAACFDLILCTADCRRSFGHLKPDVPRFGMIIVRAHANHSPKQRPTQSNEVGRK